MKIILRIFLGLVGLAVLTFGAAIFYLSASLGIIDVPWLSDTPNDVVGADSGSRTRFTSNGNRSPEQPASSGAEPSVPQPPVRDAREIEKVIDRDLSDDDRFEMVLSESEINQLLLSELSRDGRIRAVDVYVTPDLIEFNGELKGRIPIPFHGSLKFLLDAGKAVVDVQEIKLGVIPLAGFAKEGMNALLNEVGDLNRALAETGQVEITEIELSTGSMRIAGRKRGAALAGMPNLSLDRPPIDPAILPKPRSRAVTEPAVKRRCPGPGFISLSEIPWPLARGPVLRTEITPRDSDGIWKKRTELPWSSGTSEFPARVPIHSSDVPPHRSIEPLRRFGGCKLTGSRRQTSTPSPCPWAPTTFFPYCKTNIAPTTLREKSAHANWKPPQPRSSKTWM